MSSTSIKKRSDSHDLDHEANKVQSAALQIYKKSNRLKTKIRAIQIASRLNFTASDPNKEDKKKQPMEVYKPPDCLKNVLSKITQEKRDRKENISDADDKYVHHQLIFFTNNPSYSFISLLLGF